MEDPPTSQRSGTDRSDNVRDSVRNDIRLDGEWKHRQFCEGTPGCKPIGIGRLFAQNIAPSLQVH